MTGKHTAIVATGATVLVVLAALLAFILVTSQRATAQEPVKTPRSTMDQRMGQVIEVINRGRPCQAVDAAIDEGMEILYGGLRTLPSKGPLLKETTMDHQGAAAAELHLAAALQRFAIGAGCGELHGRALDLKLFIEQMNEVADVAGQVTAKCGIEQRADGSVAFDSLDQGPCFGLRPILDEAMGEEIPVGLGPQTPGNQNVALGLLHPSYSVKLRSPFVPSWFGNNTWDEDVQVTDPIKPGDCVGVFKESRGLMLKLHFDRIIIATDAWDGVRFVDPITGEVTIIHRQTPIPVWRMEWVPSEYVKVFNLCNKDGNLITTVTQRVKQDAPLNFFWRFFPGTPAGPVVRR